MGAAAKINPDQVRQSAKVIVFARDGKKARGSWFPSDNKAQAHAAAEAMGMNVLDVANDDVRQLATRLPKGRIFESGKAFVPFIQGSVLEALAAHLPDGQELKAMSAGAGAGGGGQGSTSTPVEVRHHPKGWDDITVGSLVLACEEEKEGWFECVVQAFEDGQLRLRWLDYPAYEAFHRPPNRVALLWSPPTLSDKK